MPRVEGTGQVDARPRQSRCGPEQQAGRHRQAGRERECDAVQGDVGEAGNAPRDQGRCGAHDSGRHRAADGAAGNAQEHALRQQLADDPAPARAKRSADGQLAPPGDAAREEQAGDVGAGHQQHEPGRGREHGQRRPERAPQLFPQADHSPHRWGTRFRPGSLRPVAVDDRPHLCLRLVRRHAGPQAPDAQHEAGVLQHPVGRGFVGRHHERRPEPGRRAGWLEAFGQHPDHGVRPVVDTDGGADHVRVRTESARPRTVAQQHDRGRALLRVRRGEEPAEVRRGSQQREIGRGHGRAREVAVRPGPRHGHARSGGELLERPRVGPQPAQLRVRQRRRPRSVRPYLAHEHDRLRVGIRQRTEQQAVDDAEQRGVRADAQREHEHHRAREAGAAPQAAGGVAHVAPQIVEPPPAPDITGAFANQGRVPQPSTCRQPGFGLGDAGVPLPLMLEIQVQAKLVLKVPFRCAAAEVRQEAIHPDWPLHGWHPSCGVAARRARDRFIVRTSLAPATRSGGPPSDRPGSRGGRGASRRRARRPPVTSGAAAKVSRSSVAMP